MARTKQAPRIPYSKRKLRTRNNQFNPLIELIPENFFQKLQLQVLTSDVNLESMKRMGFNFVPADLPADASNLASYASTNSYIECFRKAESEKDRIALLHEVIQNEYTTRVHFVRKASDLGGAKRMKNRGAYLIRVHDVFDLFGPQFQSYQATQSTSHRLFAMKDKTVPKSPLIVDKSQFLKNWQVFSEGIMDDIQWGNLLVAGSPVLCCLLPPQVPQDLDALRRWFHEDMCMAVDIDIYMYGLNEEQAKAKMRGIFQAVEKQYPHSPLVCRSAFACTIVTQHPRRNINIILKLHSCPAEILMNMDVDCCSVGFDGTDVLMTPRCHLSIARQCNTVDTTRRNSTYEDRLAKYSELGFEVELPNLDGDQVNPLIFDTAYEQLHGLSKLVVLDKLRTPNDYQHYKDLMSYCKIQSNLKMLKSQPERQPRSNELYIPWSPDTTPELVRKSLKNTEQSLNSSFSTDSMYPSCHFHPFFVGSMDSVFNGNCSSCSKERSLIKILEDQPGELLFFVCGPISFRHQDYDENLMQKLCHHLVDTQWEHGYFISKDTESLCVASNEGVVGEIERLIEVGSDVNCMDCVGRTPIQIAALNNQVNVIQLLLDKGADASVLMPFDSRNLLHICAQYGHIDSLRYLVERCCLSKSQSSSSSYRPPGRGGGKRLNVDSICPSSGLSPLGYAVMYGRVDVVEYLLSVGAVIQNLFSVQSEKEKKPILLFAAHNERRNASIATAIYDLLHKHGLDIERSSVKSTNIFHFLGRTRYYEFTKHVIEMNPNSSAELLSELDLDSLFPIDIAVVYGDNAMATIFSHACPIFIRTPPILEELDMHRKQFLTEVQYDHAIKREQNSFESRTPLLFSLLSKEVEPSMVTLFKRLIESSNYNINYVHNKHTLLDSVVSKRPYKKWVESMSISASDLDKAKSQIESVKTKLQGMCATPFQEFALKSKLNRMEVNLRMMQEIVSEQPILEEQMVACKMNDDTHEGCVNQLYNYLVSKGALSYSEMNPVLLGSGNSELVSNNRSNYNTNYNTDIPQSMSRKDRLLKLSKPHAPSTYNSLTIVFESDEINPIVMFYQGGDPGDSAIRNTASNPRLIVPQLSILDMIMSKQYDALREICSSSGGPGLMFRCCDKTPFSLAVEMKDKKMVLLVLDILADQFTPRDKDYKDPSSTGPSPFSSRSSDESMMIRRGNRHANPERMLADACVFSVYSIPSLSKHFDDMDAYLGKQSTIDYVNNRKPQSQSAKERRDDALWSLSGSSDFSSIDIQDHLLGNDVILMSALEWVFVSGDVEFAAFLLEALYLFETGLTWKDRGIRGMVRRLIGIQEIHDRMNIVYWSKYLNPLCSVFMVDDVRMLRLIMQSCMCGMYGMDHVVLNKAKISSKEKVEPVLLFQYALCYNATTCLEYLRNKQLVLEDITLFMKSSKSLNSLKYYDDRPPEVVYDQLFSSLYSPSNVATMLTSACVDDDVASLSQFVGFLQQSQGVDVSSCVASTTREMCLACCVAGHSPKCCSWIMNHFDHSDQDLLDIFDCALSFIIGKVKGGGINVNKSESFRNGSKSNYYDISFYHWNQEQRKSERFLQAIVRENELIKVLESVDWFMESVTNLKDDIRFKVVTHCVNVALEERYMNVAHMIGDIVGIDKVELDHATLLKAMDSGEYAVVEFMSDVMKKSDQLAIEGLDGRTAIEFLSEKLFEMVHSMFDDTMDDVCHPREERYSGRCILSSPSSDLVTREQELIRLFSKHKGSGTINTLFSVLERYPVGRRVPVSAEHINAHRCQLMEQSSVRSFQSNDYGRTIPYGRSDRSTKHDPAKPVPQFWGF